MPDDDPFSALERNREELDRDVRELAAFLGGSGVATLPAHLAGMIADVRDELVVHFVREEEGLFPVLARHAELEPAVDRLIAIHDEICATASRLVYLAQSGSLIDTLIPIFRRFEAAYARNVDGERSLLERAAGTLTPAERADLAHILRTR